MIELLKKLFNLVINKPQNKINAEEIAFNTSFNDWLVIGERKKTLGILLIIIALSIIIISTNLTLFISYLTNNSINGNKKLLFIDSLSIFLIIYSLTIGNFNKLFFTKEYYEKNKAAILHTNETISSLNRLWTALWLSWLSVYVLVLLNDICAYYKIGVLESDPWHWTLYNLLPFMQTLFNNVGNAIMFSFYCLFAYASRFNKQGSIIISRPKYAGRFYKRIWMTVIFISCVDLVSRIVFRNYLIYVDLSFGLISGFLGAISLSLLIGRIDSKFFHVPFPALFILFGYSAIQGLYPILSSLYLNVIDNNVKDDLLLSQIDQLQSVIKFSVIAYALCAKFVLLSVFRWLNGSKKLFMYFLYFNQINFETVEKINSVKSFIDFEKSDK